jgi:hypothetical protein
MAWWGSPALPVVVVAAAASPSLRCTVKTFPPYPALAAAAPHRVAAAAAAAAAAVALALAAALALRLRTRVCCSAQADARRPAPTDAHTPWGGRGGRGTAVHGRHTADPACSTATATATTTTAAAYAATAATAGHTPGGSSCAGIARTAVCLRTQRGGTYARCRHSLTTIGWRHIRRRRTNRRPRRLPRPMASCPVRRCDRPRTHVWD